MKKQLATVLAATMLVCGLSACGSSSAAGAASEKTNPVSYFNVINTQNTESGGVNIPTSTDYCFSDNGDGTYTLYENMTIDITEASQGYLSAVGGGKVLYGNCTQAVEDGETVYKLEKPNRVIMSSYMMTGPDSTMEVYVDSANADTYAAYSMADITGMSESDVVDMLLKTNTMGVVADGDAAYNTTVVVDTDKFALVDLY